MDSNLTTRIYELYEIVINYLKLQKYNYRVNFISFRRRGSLPISTAIHITIHNYYDLSQKIYLDMFITTTGLNYRFLNIEPLIYYKTQNYRCPEGYTITTIYNGDTFYDGEPFPLEAGNKNSYLSNSKLLEKIIEDIELYTYGPINNIKKAKNKQN